MKEKQKREINKKQISICCIGDSLTAGEFSPTKPKNPNSYQYWTDIELRKAFYEVLWENHGQPGAVLSQIIEQIDKSSKTDILIAMGGTNDCWLFSSQDDEEQNKELRKDIKEKFRLLYQNARKHGFLRIFICTIPPVRISISQSAATKSMLKNILEINEYLRNWIIKENNPNFCIIDLQNVLQSIDINDFDGELAGKYTEFDGIHFSLEGNKACGKEIAYILLKNIK